MSNKLQTYKQERINVTKGSEGEALPAVIPSSADLFGFYRQTLTQCAKLSTSTPLVDLSRLFGKWLTVYAEQVLCSSLEKSTSMTTIMTIDDICITLNTADYCLTTTTQLEDRIKVKVDETLRDQVQLDSSRESFMQAANLAIKLLVRKVEAEVELPFREMINTNWSHMDNVGDQSGYVNEMVQGIQNFVKDIMEHGHIRERYVRSLCDRVVEWFGTKFIEMIVSCRPISEAGAEQVFSFHDLFNCRCCWMYIS